MIPFTQEGYRLLHQGARALARVESAGIRVDEAYLESAIVAADQKVRHLESELAGSEVVGEWKSLYGSSTNLQSRVQLGRVLSDVLGLELPKTASGRPQTDEGALSSIDHPFIKAYLDIAKFKKARSTYLIGLKREVVGGLIHPFFNLHTVQTYRSSSDSPNFQNFPVRDLEISSLIRRAFIPRPGHKLMEVDFGGIEVRVAACYHRDPVMLKYIRDPSSDLHRDMAAECYCVPEAEVTKELRFAAKNQFVFPQFYGDYFGNCAPRLWESCVGRKLGSGVTVIKNLKRHGITELGTIDSHGQCSPNSFMAHIRQVQENFWGRRFKVYNQWRKNWVKQYEETGELRLLSGFICRGLGRKNEITNYPIQGSAFHCLLWSLIRIVLVELGKRKLKSLVVGQIHDSLVGDVLISEVEQFKDMVIEVMTEILPREWTWIIVPLTVEVTTYSQSWAEKD